MNDFLSRLCGAILEAQPPDGEPVELVGGPYDGLVIRTFPDKHTIMVPNPSRPAEYIAYYRDGAMGKFRLACPP